MREWQSLSHVRWYCRYHVVFVPKSRKRSIFGQLRKDIGRMLRDLCVHHEVSPRAPRKRPIPGDRSQPTG